MFNVKVDTIRDRTTNGPTYMKGRQYYRQGKVRQLTYDQERGIILAQVEGTRTYNVRIILNGNGDLHDAICTCSAFAAYWGLCRHIAAALLYCVDAFSQQKTHILPAIPKNGNGGQKTQNREDQDTQPPGHTESKEQHARQQAYRRSRSKTRDFLSRMEHAARLSEHDGKKNVHLQVMLHCTPASFTLPWLSFSVGENQLYPVANVEQFAEAISRSLALELDKDFTLDPLLHGFSPGDMPLIAMLQDAFENDYKSVFGSSHASSRDRYLTLNASRFADFLSFSGSLTDSCWQNVKDRRRHSILVQHADLPIRLHLGNGGRTNGNGSLGIYKLELVYDQPVIQMTASRNIYLVGDTFYLPPPESIRLIEPILSSFNSPGFRQLFLTRDETVFLLGEIRPRIQAVCPISVENSLAAKIIDMPLKSTVDLDCESGEIQASISFQYGKMVISPLSVQSDENENNQLVLRDRKKEEQLLQFLGQAGFTRHGLNWRISEPDDMYNFLAQHLETLRTLAEIQASDDFSRIRILPPPDIHFEITLPENHDALELKQDYKGLSHEEYRAYFQALRDKRNHFRTQNGHFRQVCLEGRDTLLELYDLMQLWDLDPASRHLMLPRYRAMALESVLSGKKAEQIINASESVKLMIRNLSEPSALAFRLPQSLRVKLRPYQKVGYQWLRSLDYYGLGGILADDMGLGKTLQAIAFVVAIWQKCRKPSLIIAPTSLVYNWASEFERFAPHLPVMVLDGNRQQRTDRLGEILENACTITSYSLLRRDIEEFGSCSFASCFLDEAQNIKNPETLNARSVKQVKADRYFALTGTPLENSLTELWSIFDFILPGYLYSQKSFQNVFEIPIIRDGSQEAFDLLHRQIRPFILRRMKKDVLKELPDKIETRTICDMTEEQREIYQSFLFRSKSDLEREINENGYAKSQIYILALLTRLRQICCHPVLFMKKYKGGSGKLALLEELLADCFSAGHRVLVFSQFTSMLDLIRENQQAAGLNPFYIDGQVAADDRINQVQRFNQGEGQLFLISLRAGGTGLNLTGADTVIHFDPWWNPAVEDQATDRAYRIGQENVVQVIKLYTRHSIEEKIQQLQEKKKNLIDRVIKPGQNLLTKMTLEEVRSLFEP